ncbi:succinate dehydrogenase assembly factor 4, mitochondrial [Pteronotus mesoamericanus]|uniref:succinate dehydrogenase assembly factor 4, mitochondrial n=1 Tax=Pteronotus mesoamericanus TaxID=1884717 RepID=UPI0023ED5ADD|nr:succinate dehydrogenase assembly factor 4, mitochondrial [Pteronotus parnellii mesoamericanus]
MGSQQTGALGIEGSDRQNAIHSSPDQMESLVLPSTSLKTHPSEGHLVVRDKTELLPALCLQTAWSKSTDSQRRLRRPRPSHGGPAPPTWVPPLGQGAGSTSREPRPSCRAGRATLRAPSPGRASEDAAGLGAMVVSGLAGCLGRAPAAAWRAARVPLLCHSWRKTSSSQDGKSEPIKQSLKKPKLPEGRFDAPKDTYLEKEPLTKFPDDVNPITKEKGGPRGPEPTRYGDWERKGRCIDF